MTETPINIPAFYSIFRDISKSVHSSTNVKEVLDLVVKKCTEATSARGALLRILNLETSELELSAAYGLSEKYLSKGHVSSQKVITELCRQNKVIIVQDVLTDPRIQYPKEAAEEGIRSVLDVPLILGNHVVGILRIFFDEKRLFPEEELNFVVSIAEQCACAIDKARLIETHKSQYDHLALQTEKLSALGRMAAGIAHEINNPLAGILLYSTNLVKKVPADSALREGLDIIVHETIRCKSIIQELLEFSREKEPERTRRNVNDVIERALSILENEFRLHHVRVEKDLSSEMPDVFIDGNQIQQVLINLLLNAVEAIQENGAVRIRSYPDPAMGRIGIEITDTGCGIAPENINKVFEPFFSTKPKGTGLGLAVSYGIVRNHGGDIDVSSVPSQGTSFHIYIPAFTGGAAIEGK
ncbi:MAG: GAF domain-containing protein [Deltaproteobacteria bacterium]|nr:GAF domain-containing protein [Deltaproteobacteria bacterium]